MVFFVLAHYPAQLDTVIITGLSGDTKLSPRGHVQHAEVLEKGPVLMHPVFNCMWARSWLLFCNTFHCHCQCLPVNYGGTLLTNKMMKKAIHSNA